MFRSTIKIINDLFYLFSNKSTIFNIISYLKTKFLFIFFLKKIKFVTSSDLNILKNINYTQDWFSQKIKYLNLFFILEHENLKKHKSIVFMEIGCWEGMSSFYFNHKLNPEKLILIDNFMGSDETYTVKREKKLISMAEAKNNFLVNIKNFKEKSEYFECSSKFFFENLSYHDSNFLKPNIVHIDGSHFYDDVYNDCIKSFNILCKNGYLIIDDYLWYFYENKKNPINAINKFLDEYKDSIRIVLVYHQIIIQKK